MLIYLSYHNNNLIFAFKLANALYRYHNAIWFDRFAVDPTENWEETLIQTRQSISHAVVILSDDYLATDYCLLEYQYLMDNQIPTILVIADDVAIGQAPTYFEINDWIDFRNRTEGTVFNIKVNDVVKRLPPSQENPNQSERQNYLLELITEIETRLAKIPTTRAIYQSQENRPYGEHIIRPRGYNLSLLSQWHLLLQVEAGSIDIEDVLSWYESQAQFALLGKAGSGKTIIAQLLALWTAHRALSDYTVPLPIWLDLALWLPDQTPEDFIDNNWPLMHYWKTWVDSYETLFIFDNWTDFCQQNADQIEGLNDQITTLLENKIIILARSGEHMIDNLEKVTIGIMPNHSIQRFARDFLPIEMTGNFKRLVAQNQNQLALKNIDFISCGIELIATDAAVAVESWFTNPVTSLITLRWNNHYSDVSQPFSLNYFIKTMKLLAWHMMLADQHRWIDRGLAEETVFKIEVIQVAIDLGILDIVGWSLRFHTEMFQWYLASERLEEDGLYKHLAYPKFLDNGDRQATRWDNVILALIDRVGENRRQQIIDQVAEIDPYLAWQCMQQFPELIEDDLPQIITKLILLRSTNIASQQALTRVLQSIRNREAVAQRLLNEIPQYEWGVKQDLWAELQALAVEVPEDFVKYVHTLDRQFEDAIFNLLKVYSIPQCQVYLSYLIHDTNDSIRYNAIWLVGGLKYKALQVGLFELLDSEDSLTQHEALTALAMNSDDKLIQKLMMWLAHNPSFAGGVGSLLYDNGRYVSGRMLMILHDENAEVDPALRNAIIKHPEERIAWAVAQYIAEETGDDELVNTLGFDKDSIMNVVKLVRSGLDRLPKDSVNSLLDAVQRNFNLTDDESSDKKNESQLYLRTQSALASARPNSSAGDGSHAISPSITADLRDADWLVRRKATEQLASFHRDVALPLLVNSAKDPDAQVRITALTLLAKFKDSSLAKDTVIDALTDNEVVVVDAVTDLIKEGDVVDAPTVLNLLASDNVQVIASAIDIVRHKKYPIAVENLIGFLDDERQPWMDQTLGDYASKALLAIGTPEALDAVGKSKYQVAEVPTVTAQAAPTKPETKKYTPIEKINITLKVLRGNNWGKAQKAARFLREFSAQLKGTTDLEIVQTLCDALDDPEWHVRWAVAEALAWLGHRSACPYLAKRLHDTNWIVQVAVIRSLVELKASEYAVEMSYLLDHENQSVRETVAESLGLLGNPAVIPTLELALNHEDDFVRLATIKSIHQLRDDSSVDYLLLGLDDSYLHVRWFAVQKLVSYFAEEDIELLEELLHDDRKPSWEEKTISDFAYEALLNIDTPEAQALIKNRKLSSK